MRNVFRPVVFIMMVLVLSVTQYATQVIVVKFPLERCAVSQLDSATMPGLTDARRIKRNSVSLNKRAEKQTK